MRFAATLFLLVASLAGVAVASLAARTGGLQGLSSTTQFAAVSCALAAAGVADTAIARHPFRELAAFAGALFGLSAALVVAGVAGLIVGDDIAVGSGALLGSPIAMGVALVVGRRSPEAPTALPLLATLVVGLGTVGGAMIGDATGTVVAVMGAGLWHWDPGAAPIRGSGFVLDGSLLTMVAVSVIATLIGPLLAALLARAIASHVGTAMVLGRRLGWDDHPDRDAVVKAALGGLVASTLVFALVAIAAAWLIGMLGSAVALWSSPIVAVFVGLGVALGGQLIWFIAAYASIGVALDSVDIPIDADEQLLALQPESEAGEPAEATTGGRSGARRAGCVAMAIVGIAAAVLVAFMVSHPEALTTPRLLELLAVLVASGVAALWLARWLRRRQVGVARPAPEDRRVDSPDEPEQVGIEANATLIASTFALTLSLLFQVMEVRVAASGYQFHGEVLGEVAFLVIGTQVLTTFLLIPVARVGRWVLSG